MHGLLGEAFSKAGKLNERADVWRHLVSPSADDVDADVKDEDEHTKTVAAKDAFVMNEMRNEGILLMNKEVYHQDFRSTVRRALREPTRQEINEHSITHLPFRSWCPCIAAKAEHWPHRRARDIEGAEEGVPPIHVASWFMRDDKVDENVMVINYKEKHTKAFGAHVVKKKGLGAGVAERIIKHIERWSCKVKFIVKTDQEPSIQAVTENMRELR